MKITEQARMDLMNELNARGAGLWIELESEIQRFGEECPFWVLIRRSDDIPRIYNLVTEVLSEYRKMFVDTKFSISFDECVGTKLRKWNYISPEEIESGKLQFPLGDDYIDVDLHETVYRSLRTD
jgi:hypothetical protein